MRRAAAPSFIALATVLVGACTDPPPVDESAAADFGTATHEPARSRRGASWLPTGVHVTRRAAPGSRFTALDPQVAAYPELRARQPVASAPSPDRHTLRILTRGYNRRFRRDGQVDPVGSRPPRNVVAVGRLFDSGGVSGAGRNGTAAARGNDPTAKGVLASYTGTAFNSAGEATDRHMADLPSDDDPFADAIEPPPYASPFD